MMELDSRKLYLNRYSSSPYNSAHDFSNIECGVYDSMDLLISHYLKNRDHDSVDML